MLCEVIYELFRILNCGFEHQVSQVRNQDFMWGGAN